MSHLVQLREIITRLGLVDARGRLIPLDSLGIVDLVVELEALFKVRVPPAYMSVARFRDIETVAKMVDEITNA
jgi:acyl carrier protein